MWTLGGRLPAAFEALKSAPPLTAAIESDITPTGTPPPLQLHCERACATLCAATPWVLLISVLHQAGPGVLSTPTPDIANTSLVTPSAAMACSAPTGTVPSTVGSGPRSVVPVTFMPSAFSGAAA